MYNDFLNETIPGFLSGNLSKSFQLYFFKGIIQLFLKGILLKVEFKI